MRLYIFTDSGIDFSGHRGPESSVTNSEISCFDATISRASFSRLGRRISILCDFAKQSSQNPNREFHRRSSHQGKREPRAKSETKKSRRKGAGKFSHFQRLSFPRPSSFPPRFSCRNGEMSAAIPGSFRQCGCGRFSLSLSLPRDICARVESRGRIGIINSRSHRFRIRGAAATAARGRAEE